MCLHGPRSEEVVANIFQMLRRRNEEINHEGSCTHVIEYIDVFHVLLGSDPFNLIFRSCKMALYLNILLYSVVPTFQQVICTSGHITRCVQSFPEVQVSVRQGRGNVGRMIEQPSARMMQTVLRR